MEHRLVMEQVLGRPLTTKERVHHKNTDGLDNAPGNLSLKPSQTVHLLEHQVKATWACLNPSCGKTFSSKPSARQKFCSRECYHVTHRGVPPSAGLSLGEPVSAGRRR